MSLPSINQHFRVSRPSNSIYTGRGNELQVIGKAFPTSYSPDSHTQWRFIIQGAPGSGKTELALKYAEEFMKYYWGVFWVDASTRANATQSYADIAKVGGVEPNENSAKHWLASRAYPWLLIIDNADDDEVRLEELFPPGHGGCVLITTRNPAHVSCGTAGQKYLVLGQMKSDEARDLLLLAANEPQPWKPNAVELGMAICKHLHFLPLAIVHAGKAIVSGLCSLANYINFFEGHAKRIRRERRRLDRSTSRGRLRRVEDEDNMAAFGSYEILFQSLEGAAMESEKFGDALQILQVFSYMHFQNIRLDTFIHAAVNPLRESVEAAEQQRKEDELVRRLGLHARLSWRAWIQDILRRISARLALPPVLPEALKNPEDLDADELKSEVDARVRQALKILVSRSLVTKVTQSGEHQNETDRYHMHPIVHKWVRERPRLSVAQEALFCQFATTILSCCIRLVGSDTEEEMTMQRELRPHIDHVRECSAVIQQRIRENQQRNRSIWTTVRLMGTIPTFGPQQASEFARFSKVYMACGAYAEAEKLLRRVHGYLILRLGNDHHLSHRVKLGLAVSLSHLTRNNDATGLLREVYESRRKTLGPKHPLTLEVTSQLAAGILSQGRMTESLNLCRAAREGLREAYGPFHRKTLKCVHQMGDVYQYFLNWEKAVSHFEEAIRGMEGQSGDDAPPETDVLSSKENLAISLIRLGEKHYQRAEDLMRHVVERRVEILGKEHPFALLSKAHLGRVMAARGRLDEADRLMSRTLEVAVRNLGQDHLGVLAGKVWYSQVLVAKGELRLAKRYLLEATEKHKYAKASASDGEHPDRILAVWYLVECLEKEGETREALELCRELQTNILLIGGHGLGPKHNFNIKLTEKVDVLQKRIREAEIEAEVENELVKHPSM